MSPLGRSGPLRRGKPLARRTPLRAKPPDPAERLIRERVSGMALARDCGCLLSHSEHALSECHGPLTPHHLRKASQGGGWEIDNIVYLCAGHNDAVEDHPEHYHRVGLVIRGGEDAIDAWARMIAAGLVDYRWDGQPL